MPITVHITVQTDERNSLTDLERGVLNALSGVNAVKVETQNPDKKDEVKGGSPAIVKEEDVVQDELPADDESGAVKGGTTMEEAVKKATDMVAAGKAADVKAALATAKVKRVSELKGKAIAVFLEALNA